MQDAFTAEQYNKQDPKTTCLSTAKGKSGQTLLHTVQWMKKKRPHICLLENVSTGLMGKNRESPHRRQARNMEGLKDLMAEAGYMLLPLHLDALEYGIPQHRPRTWIIAFLKDRLFDTQVPGQSLPDCAEQKLWQLGIDLRMALQVDQVLAHTAVELAVWGFCHGFAISCCVCCVPCTCG